MQTSPTASTASRERSENLASQQGERVGTFAWNNQRHLELYFAIPCSGAVLHTLNIRLFAEQLTYIVNHAEDKVIFVDDSLVPVLEKLAPSFSTVEHYVVMGGGDAGTLPNALRYEDLLDAAGPGEFDYPELDERQAAALCYTSGTTGNPKGVLYSHRSISLHSTATLMTDSTALSRADRVLAVVPMFHANAWGLPYGSALAGADLILPDRFLGAEPLAGLIAAERPTLMGCVPDDLRRPAALRRCSSRGRSLLPDQRRLRWLGGAAPADDGLRGAPPRAHLPGVGDDRDEPRRHILAAAASVSMTTPTGTTVLDRVGRCPGSSCD